MSKCSGKNINGTNTENSDFDTINFNTGTFTTSLLGSTGSTVQATNGNFTNLSGSLTGTQLLAQRTETTRDNSTVVIGNNLSTLTTNSRGVHIGYDSLAQQGSIYSMNDSGVITDLFLNSPFSYGNGATWAPSFRTNSIQEFTSSNGVQIAGGMKFINDGKTLRNAVDDIILDTTNLTNNTIRLKNQGTEIVQVNANELLLSKNLKLPTTSSTAGNITQGGLNKIHFYGSTNGFFGENCGNYTLTGGGNWAGGAGALMNLTSGQYNIGMSYQGGFSISSGSYNCAIGQNAIGNNGGSAICTGSENFALGASSLRFLTSGIRNCCICNGSGLNVTSSSNNIFCGYLAGNAITNETGGNIFIGNNQSGIAGESNTIRIGNGGASTKCYLEGIYNINPSSTGRLVGVNSSNQLATECSSLTTTAFIDSAYYKINGASSLEPGTLYLNNGTKTVTLTNSNVTASSVYTLPDKPAGTYTLATTNDVSSSSGILFAQSQTAITDAYFLGTGFISSAESVCIFFMPRSCVLRNLYVVCSGAPGVGNNYSFTVRKNGVNQALTITIVDLNVQGSNTSDTVSVVAGDQITIQLSISIVSVHTACLSLEMEYA
jgi:hypothetical protein